MAGAPGARGARLLVLGAGPGQLGLLEAARRLGVETIAADRDPAAPGFALADRRALVSSEDEPELGRLAEAERVDGIVSPGADWTVGVAARLAGRLGLPHPVGPGSAALVTSKARQRAALAEAGVPQPAVLDPAAPYFPCVVKPADRQGQRGITVVRSPQELRPAVEHAAAESRAGTVVVEELVEGPEVTVNAVSVGGAFHPLTVTERHTADPPAFGVALAHVWPCADAEGAAEAVRVAAVAAEALGVREGPTYTQVRLGPDGPRVLELAARLGGGHDAELCAAALGVDLNALAIAFALGERVDPPVPEPRGGAVVRFLVAPEGELRAVEGVEEALALEGIEWVRVYRRAGWRFGPLRTGPDRAGALLAVGADRGEALERAARAAQAVRFRVDAHAP